MRQETVRAVLEAVREILRRTGTIHHRVQRAKTEQAVEVLCIIYFMAREIRAVRITEEACRVLHS